ncbi:MAG: hypothetical protein AB7D51_07470 [Desulfovibrionaceae bacterium]
MNIIWFGITMCAIGLMTYLTGTYKYGMPVYKWVGWLFVVTGLPFWVIGLIRVIRGTKPTDRICPVCESVFLRKDGPELICPHDGEALEPMKGYYERHPERRDAPVTPNRTDARPLQ